MAESRIDIQKAEDEGGKGTQSISSPIRQTPEVTEKTENEGGKTIYSSMLKGGKAVFSFMLKGGKGIFSSSSQPPEKANYQVGIQPPICSSSSQPPEKANYQVGIQPPICSSSSQPPQSNNVTQMFPPGLFHLLPHGSENIESDLLALDRKYKFEDMIGGTFKIRKWYAGVERRLSNTELSRMMEFYTDEELGRMTARSGLLLLEFLRSQGAWQLSVQEAVIKIENQIPIYVLKKILEWERDPNKDENRLGSDGDADGDADKDENRGCMQIKMKTGEGDADTDLDSILKHAWLKLSPIQYDSEVIARVPLKDGSHLLEFVYENIIRSSVFKHAYNWRKIKRRVRHISLLQAEQLQGEGVKNKRRHITLPRADQLKGKGVKFARNEGLLKTIRFERRNLTLYLPAIKMDGGTDALLRNLVLFEASKQEKRSQPLMSYVDLMDRLIDAPEDVQALRDVGIIECHLATNNEVANVWNGMRRELPAEIIKYKPIDNAIGDVISFYTNKHRIMYTEFKRRYCSKPWIVLSVISACILLALTVLQTLLSWEQVRLQLKSMNKT